MRTHILLLTVGLTACLPSTFDRVSGVAGERDSGRDTVVVTPAHDAGAADSGGTSADVGAAGSSGSAGSTGSVDEADGSAGRVSGAAGEAIGGGGDSRGAAGQAAGSAGVSGQAGAAGAAATDRNAGAGAAGNAAAAGSSGAGGQSSSCGDTTTDSKNCGACGNDCSASSAMVSCASSACVRACVSTRADCNGDLSFGKTGDGCETEVVDDVKNCGGCNIRCDKIDGAVGVCDNRKCMTYALSVGSPSVGSNAFHGSSSDGAGDPYQQFCGRDEVLVGVNAASDGNVMYGFGALCARVLLGGTSTQFTLSLGAADASPMLGNMINPPQPQSQFMCPAGAIVTAVSGVTWNYLLTSGPSPNLSVKQFVLTCSQIALDGERHAIFTPAGTLTIGSADAAIETFSDSCPAGAAVVGWSGRAGAYIDGAQTECGALSLSYESSGSSVQK